MLRARFTILALVVAASALSIAMPAQAASLPGPGGFSTGLVDYPLFMQSPAPVQAFWLNRGRALGSTTVRLQAFWSQIAPSRSSPSFQAADPRASGYQWASLDAEVRAAAAQGQSVVLLVRAAPSWAEARGRPAGVPAGTWFPNAGDFGAFAHAIALRYSGLFRDPLHPHTSLPRVRYFQAWNEPNLPNYLMPQWSRSSNGTWQPVSPGIYRALLNAFYRGVKSAQRDGFVLAAGTAPYGDPPATGQGRMAPVTFLRGLFCLNAGLGPPPCPDPPHFDALDHHPYGLAPTLHARQPGDISLPDLSKIWTILQAAGRLGHALPAGPKSLWVTEIDWTSSSPGSPAGQARNVARGFYELWRQGVSHVLWFEMRDPPNQPGNFAGAGLYYPDGTAKPAAAAFRFPFVALGAAHGALTLWGRAPRAGVVAIQKLEGRRWRSVLALRSTPGAVFYAQRRLGSHVQLRAVLDGIASQPWSTG